jgi:hypothetical protein
MVERLRGLLACAKRADSVVSIGVFRYVKEE